MKQCPTERKGGITKKRAKRNWGNQSIRHRIQNNGCKYVQGTQWELKGTYLELQGTVRTTAAWKRHRLWIRTKRKWRI